MGDAFGDGGMWKDSNFPVKKGIQRVKLSQNITVEYHCDLQGKGKRIPRFGLRNNNRDGQSCRESNRSITAAHWLPQFLHLIWILHSWAKKLCVWMEMLILKFFNYLNGLMDWVEMKIQFKPPFFLVSRVQIQSVSLFHFLIKF